MWSAFQILNIHNEPLTSLIIAQEINISQESNVQMLTDTVGRDFYYESAPVSTDIQIKFINNNSYNSFELCLSTFNLKITYSDYSYIYKNACIASYANHWDNSNSELEFQISFKCYNQAEQIKNTKRFFNRESICWMKNGF